MHIIKSSIIPVIITAGALVSSVAIAAPNPAAFQASKDQQIAVLQERLQMVQTNLSCVQAASDQAGLKSCQEAAKQKNNEFQAKLKAKRAEKKARHDTKKTTP